MKETRFFYVPDAACQTELPEEEAQHALRVLRLKMGDELMLMDGNGTFFRAEVAQASSHRCFYQICESLPQPRQWKWHLHLAMAPTKMMERTEWMAEKATEIGIDELSLLSCQFSERRTVKTPRLDKILISAVKQSHKAWKPKLNDLTPFKQFIASHQTGRRFIAHCYEEVSRTNLFDELIKTDAPADDSVLVMIGPEGDFSIDEVRMAVDAGFVSIDLGKSRLRTETAALSAVMMMQLAEQLTHQQQ